MKTFFDEFLQMGLNLKILFFKIEEEIRKNDTNQTWINSKDKRISDNCLHTLDRSLSSLADILEDKVKLEDK